MSIKRRLDKLENTQKTKETKIMAVVRIEKDLYHSANDEEVIYTEKELQELESNNVFVLRAGWYDKELDGKVKG